MQHWYDMYLDANDDAFVYTEALEGPEDAEEFQLVMCGLLPSHETHKRGEELRRMKPTISH